MNSTFKDRISEIPGVLPIWYFFQSIRNTILGLRIQEPDFKNIPIIINNRNRLTYLKQLIDWLTERGYSNLIVLDNDSSYPPLLKYYQTCPAKIIYLNENLGFMALSKIDLYAQVRKGFFVYTDPDVVPIDDCPEDFLEYFYKIMKKYPSTVKVGFSLKIDDLPEWYEKKQKVLEHESAFWNNVIGENLYLASIDTTFALHRPFSRISTYRSRMIRVGFPYQMHHLPWYIDSDNLSEEESYYIEHATIGGHWTNDDPSFNIQDTQSR